MVATARIQNVGLTFEQAAQDVRDEAQSVEWMVKTAREQHAEVMNTPPTPVKWRLFVDGVESNDIRNVRWNSQLRFQYSRMDVVVAYALDMLTRLSPVLTGRYKATHLLLIDGVPSTSLADWDWDQEIVITNVQPYARKIEVGAMQMRVPGTDHVFQTAAKFTRSEYGNVASITFTYRGLVAGAMVNPALAQTREHNRADLRYPIMIITAEH